MDLLSRRDKKLLSIATLIQMGTSALDLVGVLLIGLVGALSVTTIQSQPPPASVQNLADTVGLERLSSQELVVLLAAIAAAVLLTKSVVSAHMTRRVLKFLANRQALVSARLTKELLSRPLAFVQMRSSQETAYALITGVSAATSLILGQVVIAASEFALLVVLGTALLILSPWVAIGAIVFFALVAWSLQRIMGNWAGKLGRVGAQADIGSLDRIQEALSVYREIVASDRRDLYVARIQDLRWQAARVAADGQFVSMFPKYAFEAALVLGGFALAAILFSTQDSVVAVGTLALFLAAATRIMPSLLRLQGAALSLRGAAGVAGTTFDLAQDLGNPRDLPTGVPSDAELRRRIERGNPDFTPALALDSVTFSYPGSEYPSLDGISMEVPPGESIALVGPSGAGKSTLADVILGLLEPSSGSAALGGVPPQEALQRWPGGVAYVPQDVTLVNGSVRENVALGFTSAAIDDDRVWNCLTRAHLDEYLRAGRAGLDTRVGERGVRLSGGQRQRLGIARALYSNPRLLVMDEATSALDAETEEAIGQMITELGGTVTTVLIAHRLSTVRNVDQVIYMDAGKVVASGTFEQVISAVPAFARQADLLGLSTPPASQDSLQGTAVAETGAQPNRCAKPPSQLD